MRPYWITFGQIHIHKFNYAVEGKESGPFFDKNCVAEIQAEDLEDAMQKAEQLFGKLFSRVCEFEPDMLFYPRGIIKIEDKKIVQVKCECTKEEKDRLIKVHKDLHSSLDRLVACMIDNTNKLPSQTTVMELMTWSFEQTKNPSCYKKNDSR